MANLCELARLIQHTRGDILHAVADLARDVATGDSAHLPFDAFAGRMLLLLEAAHTRAAVLGRRQAGDHSLVDASDHAFGRSVIEGTDNNPGEGHYLANFHADLKRGRYGGVPADGAYADASAVGTGSTSGTPDNGQKEGTGTDTGNEPTDTSSGSVASSGIMPVTSSGIGFPLPLDVTAISRRALLYADRLRGTANQTWALAQDPETLIDWVLGSEAEQACPDCPARAAGGPYHPLDLPGVPGDNSTACMGNCKCHLEVRLVTNPDDHLNPPLNAVDHGAALPVVLHPGR